MIPAERQRAALRLLEDKGTISIAALVEVLGVSHMTVRRDIQRLEEMGRVVSVAGGVSLPARMAMDQSHRVKEGLQRAEKTAIADVAAQQVSMGDVVFLDAGTTILAIARRLAQMDGLTVITNDVAIATFLSGSSENELYLAGGRMDRANLSSEGPMTASTIASFNIDVSFMSTSAFDLHGTSVTSEEKLVVKQAIIENSSRTILASDSTKYGKVATHRAIGFQDFAAVVSDTGLGRSVAERIHQLGVPLLLSEPKTPEKSDLRKDYQ
ncbi:DeoR/GlpR family DNA-binding transcription regulator [Arthrobacter sp. JSM 101049]|uniref:DeoR/GlpR family DNA-binding transcription regulator n=1 Tax=Arthrobacter sp. JSM 101049 TaxID=929097 RepID=UPI00356825E2